MKNKGDDQYQLRTDVRLYGPVLKRRGECVDVPMPTGMYQGRFAVLDNPHGQLRWNKIARR